MANRQKLTEVEAQRPEEYQKGQSVLDAEQAVRDQQALRPGDYESRWDERIEDALARATGRPDFRYDFNTDPLYQQYRQQYTQLGRQAAANAAAESAALTGGYGNSYAASAAAQADQAYLDRLNGILPELYDRAAARYDAEGDALWRELAAYRDLDDTDYGRYRDRYGDWEDYLGYLTGRADTEYSHDYGRYTDRYAAWQDWLDHWMDDYNSQIAQEQWAAELAEQQRQFDAQLAFDREQFAYRQEQDAAAAAAAAISTAARSSASKSAGSSGSGTAKKSSGTGTGTAKTQSSSLDHNVYNELRALSGDRSMSYDSFAGRVQYQLQQGKISAAQADSLLQSWRAQAISPRL